MEVVGGIANVIAVVELTAKIAKVCMAYINEVRGAHAEIKALNDKVVQIGIVLTDLDRLLKGPHGDKLKTSQRLRDTLLNCKNELEDLLKKIEFPKPDPTPAQSSVSSATPPKERWKSKFFGGLKRAAADKGISSTKIVRALSWPLEKPEVEKIVSRLMGMEDIIRFALQVDEMQAILEVDTKITLINLPVAEGAAFGWYGDEHEPKCLPNTRQDLLKKIQVWSRSTDKHIFWLSGAAGTGKSTIARTVAERFQQDKLLGASFFFRRNAGERGNAAKFFTTLAYNLMQHIPKIRLHISNAIEKEPDLPRKVLNEQFEKLLLEPLKFAKPIPGTILVIDALDECDNDRDVLVIIKLLGRLKDLDGVDIRLFVTSRRETFINLGFEKISGAYQDLVLHDIEEQKIQHDIKVLIKHEFCRIKEEHAYRDTLPADWPSEDTVEVLVKMASPLFIVAATICRLLDDQESLPESQLEDILKGQQRLLDANPERSLALTYAQVFNQRLKNKTRAQIKTLIAEFKQIIGTIVCLEIPLSRRSLSNLIALREEQIRCRLDAFHSILNIPKEPDLPIKTFHLSFREYLLDPATKLESQFWLDEREIHKSITNYCLDLMQKHLKKNICHLPSPGYSTHDISKSLVNNFIPPELQYACQYWVRHLMKSQEPLTDQHASYTFLQGNLLEWLEATLLLGIYHENIDNFTALEASVLVERGVQFDLFLKDAKRFIQFSNHIVTVSPLQLYSSALLFSPENSIIRSLFSKNLDWVKVAPKLPKGWGFCLNTIKFHPSAVTAIAFANHAPYVVTLCFEAVICWDTNTGFQKQTLEHADKYSTVGIIESLSGALISLGSSDGHGIDIWDTTSDTVTREIALEGNRAHAVLPTKDGAYILSGGNNMAIDVWSTKSWDRIWSFVGHTGPIREIQCSRNCQLVASSSYEDGVKIWDIETRSLLISFAQNAFARPSSLSFSSSSKLLACRDTNNHVAVLKVSPENPEIIWRHSLPPGPSSVPYVGFFGENILVTSTIRDFDIWDICSDRHLRKIDAHKHRMFQTAVCTHSPTLLTTGLEGIKIWDLSSKGLLENNSTTQNPNRVACIAVSSNRELVISATQPIPLATLWRITSSGLDLLANLTPPEAPGDLVSMLADSVAFSSDSTLCVVTYTSVFHPYVYVYDVKTGDLLYRYSNGESEEEFEGRLTAAFSPNNRLLSMVDFCKTKIFNADTGTTMKLSAPDNLLPNDSIHYTAFSVDSQFLAIVWCEPDLELRPRLDVEIWCATRLKRLKTIKISQWQESLSSLIDGNLLLEIEIEGVPVFFNISEFSFHEYNIFKKKHIGQRGIYLDLGWVFQDGEKILFVPSEFQPNNGSCIEIWGNNMVIGHSDEVSLIKLGRCETIDPSHR
ncbi:hypothetical protein H072_9911 [Dactylellina haptotyla CBS 200.50]|uniref:NACHT domain-containing protein n=1 Tax=Dactylellina haptotyla (strain CBS 200.50) TaxID=1284197 RepID=S8A607_DACHA|nr:hypothetical protein H072_9911 [Dactylellina haptotyla CBS 200.50]